jgi:endoglucanase
MWTDKLRISAVYMVVFMSSIVSLSFAESLCSDEIMKNTWTGFKHYFIAADGRVMRPAENDTVSEGQAYAMLRAVWLNDKETFDKCYRWTEKNMSRRLKNQDSLLGWHWKDGGITDWMPASDADIDYAASLIFAHSRWGKNQPKDLRPYSETAGQMLSDILEKETFRTKNGRLYFSPWLIEKTDETRTFPLNPSYFSPAQFRVFHEFSPDNRWLELVDTTYFMLEKLSAEFDGKKGVGLFPDWCSVDNNDLFLPLEDKNSGFGYEAIRVFFRISLDYLWNKEHKAKMIIDRKITPFIESEFKRQRAVYCEYAYDGTPVKRYENPGFYSCYASAIMASNSRFIDRLADKNQSYLKKNDGRWTYQNNTDYYTNCLGWLYDGLKSEIIINLFKE